MLKNKLAEWGLPSWYLAAFSSLVIFFFGLIALGGSVRIMKAGLACPDWPLCFGDMIPNYHPQVYFEFIHRVVAGCATLGTLGLSFILFRSRAPRALKNWVGLALVLLAFQIVFGGLTVLWLLKSGVVATHLVTGAGIFLTLLWVYLSMKPSAREELGPSWLLGQSVFVFLAAYTQVLLGGLVAANFASLVCIDFPTCHGQWFPTWSGIIGIHMIHRYFAYTVFTILLANWLIIRKVSPSPRLRKLSGILFLCVCGQICLGVANVLLLTPPLIAVAHLALGIGILSVTVRQLHLVVSQGVAVATPPHVTESLAVSQGALS